MRSNPTAHESVVPRVRRPSWRDPRLLVGLVLVAASVVIGSWAVASAGRTVPVFAAGSVLTPGDVVGPDDLVVAEVRLSPADLGRYVQVADGLDEGSVVVRTVGAGEIVPTAALGRPEGVAVSPVAFEVGAALSDRVSEGAPVDVWFVPEEAAASVADHGSPDAPVALVRGGVVDEIADESGSFVVGSTVVVQVLVPDEELPGVLAATAGRGSVRIVPAVGA
ncbi:flagellar protein FlgA [Paraoerskovia sediminicola]|uniref:Flagellar protein FlgA n=1 Tax=Paraoerskovia sediminicola TaxID=1138587 RepID=A0ABM8G488_9CELL|nr:hypothetical protein [Paraoerskovia sediminicola]BDZ42918.1 flagellar protein FlgA [Paraoerskovia sediminicola]